MVGLENYLLELKEYNNLLSYIKDGISPINIFGVADSHKTHIIASISKHLKRQCIIITYDDIQAKKIYQDLSYFAKENVLLFPTKELMLYEIEAYSIDIVKQRLQVLDELCNNQHGIIITSIAAMQQYTIPYNTYINNKRTFKVGNCWNIDKIAEDFIIMGYERVDMVEGAGQFSIRGGIVDVYSVIAKNPYRMEFFDDEIDSIREFDIITQTSISKIDEINVPVSKEVILHENDINVLIEQLNKIIKSLNKRLAKSDNREIIDTAIKKIQEDIEKLNSRRYFPSLDKYLNLIYPEQPTILEYLSKDALVFLDEPVKIKQTSQTLEYDFNETLKMMMEQGILFEQSKSLLINYPYIIEQITKKTLVGISALSHSCQDYRCKAIVNIVAKTLHSFHGKIDFLYDDLKSWKNKRYRIIILVANKESGIKLKETLNDMEIRSTYTEQLSKEIQKGEIIITPGSLNNGFEYPLINFVLISDNQIFKKEKKAPRSKLKHPSERIKAFTDLNPGDYVVHQNHGIGQYIGMEKLVVDGTTKDYLKIKYRGEAFLYVPVNQLDIIQKYMTAGERAPRINKLGGAEWVKAKDKVKKSVEDLARGLVKLYAARKSVTGYSFSPDTVWQREFEDTFIYEETDDQLICIEEVKEDMQRPKPMDRLLCGDVGYGKTEVAIRGAFKAVMDSKQVAYLVPTTVLAQQHYNNFVQRMKDFPINIEMLSRFRTVGEQKKIIEGAKLGDVDIIIGTHRLLQKDVKFKDIGLLIIDEEQRFGVTHKEKIKNLKKNIDVLTLTATPIPRTLHMSMIGIRDMSIIESPPEDRYPVQTYVLEFNEELIKNAIVKEMSRGGQVYYLHNRVATIHKVAQDIMQTIPDANVAIAHGQMNENELEDIMFNVLNSEIDVLVCTTIIETGLDIPNMNTIIIENADTMGLSQLYQLKGRVGRSNRLAYAYLTYKKDKVLSEVAQKRLQAIKQYTEFGSGFKIAMRDLEIRGAGNLLGAEQHGHMASVGYDMYCKLLEQAVSRLRGQDIEEDIETIIDINVDAHIPESYIKNHNHRIEIYKKIVLIEDLKDSYDIEEEIEDRYGDLPIEVSNIIKISLIKNLANQLKISAVTQKDDKILFYFYEGKDVNIEIISKLIAEFKGQLLFAPGNKSYLSYTVKKTINSTLLENIKIILQKLKELHEN